MGVLPDSLKKSLLLHCDELVKIFIPSNMLKINKQHTNSPKTKSSNKCIAIVHRAKYAKLQWKYVHET